MASSLSPSIEEEADESNIPGDSRESSNETITYSYGNETIIATMTDCPILESSTAHGKQAKNTRATEEGCGKSAGDMKTLKKALSETIGRSMEEEAKDGVMKTFKQVRRETIGEAISSEDLRLLVVGKTGEGKSTLVNSIIEMGEIAKEGACVNRCTDTVQLYSYSDVIPGVNVTLIDSPGLQDTQEQEQSYIEAIKSKCQEVSLVLYCMKMTDHRLTNDDKLAMQKLHQAFGPKFWERVVFVLTFANDEKCSRKDERDDQNEQDPPHEDKAAWEELKNRRFNGRVQYRASGVKEFLKKNVCHKICADLIHFFPAGDYRVTLDNLAPLQLYGQDNWLYDLLKSCCRQVRTVHKFKKLSLNDRIHLAVIIDNDGGAEHRQIISSDQLKDTLKKLGFFLLYFNGLSSESIACLLKSLQHVDHSELASFALVILSKGETHHVYDVNNEGISFKDLIDHFLKNEESLIKIPKLFFFHLSHHEKPKDELVFNDAELKLPKNSIALAVSVKHRSDSLSPAIRAFSDNVKCSKSIKNCFTKIHDTCAGSPVPIDKLSDDFLFPTPYEPPTIRKKKYFLKKQLILYRIMWHHVRCKTVNVLLSNRDEVLDIIHAEGRAEMVASAAGVVIGGGLVVAGIAAAPFTLGATIGLAVAGGVVGAAAGASNITAKVAAKVMANRKLKKAQQSVSFDRQLSQTLNKVVAKYNKAVNRCASVTAHEFAKDNPGKTQSTTIDRAKYFAGILAKGALAVTLPLDIGLIAYNSYLVYTSDEKSVKSDNDRVLTWFVKQIEELLKGTFDTLNVTKYKIANQHVTSDGHDIADDVFGCRLFVKINTTLTVCTILSGPFILPEGAILVSAVYDVLMEAPVVYTIEIEHCVDISDQSTAEKMTFATATVDFKKKAFVFTPVGGGTFPQGQTHGSISLSDSSLLCILYYSESLQDQLIIKYAAQCSTCTTDECRNYWRKDITFTKCLSVHHKYIQMDATPVVVSTHPFKFTRPSADLPRIELRNFKHSITVTEWLISPDSTKNIPEQIHKQEIDTAELQNFSKCCGIEIFPSLTLDIQVKDEEKASDELRTSIEVTGTDLRLDITQQKVTELH